MRQKLKLKVINLYPGENKLAIVPTGEVKLRSARAQQINSPGSSKMEVIRGIDEMPMSPDPGLMRDG